MGKFADFYVVPPAEIAIATRAGCGTKKWPHYFHKRLDVFQLALLYNFLRDTPGEDTVPEFGQQLEIDPFEVTVNEADGEDDFPLVVYILSTFPQEFVNRLAILAEADVEFFSERWQAHPGFFWSAMPGTAVEVLRELHRLAMLAVERDEALILVESGE